MKPSSSPAPSQGAQPRPPRLAVVYYSATGHVYSMANRLAESGTRCGAEVRLRRVPETAPPAAIAENKQWERHLTEVAATVQECSPEDLVWADAVLLGTPTRFGSVASQLQSFLDTLGPLWSEGRLADKVYAGFTSSQTTHGGQETTLLSLYHVVIHFGGLLVTPGYTDPVKFKDGNPYGVSHASGPANNQRLGEDELAALDHLAERALAVAARLATSGGPDSS